MPASNVRFDLPLIRANPWYPGQMGVPGTDSETGLRTHPTGAIFYVDPNFPGASDQRDGTNPTAPLLTIAAAVGKCQPYRGDVIVVGANAGWQYADPASSYATTIQESVTLNVAGVRLVGLFPSSSIGVPWEPAAALGTCLTVTAIDCVVEGFAFGTGGLGGNAIYCEWDGLTLFGENLTVRHCLFDDSVDIGIQLEFSWYCHIHDNWFMETDAQAIYVDPAGSGIAYCKIADNRFQNCGYAMSLQGADDCEVLVNTIFNANAQAAAVATDEGIDTTGGARNMVADNFFSCLLPAGANGDWDDLNTAAATDAWVNNHCMNGEAVTNPT